MTMEFGVHRHRLIIEHMFDTCQTEETLKRTVGYEVPVPMRTSFPIRAALLSLFGALVGSSLWLLIASVANLERAIPAVLIGVFAGAATRVESHRGLSAQLVSLVITLIGLAVVQYLVVRRAVVHDVVDAGLDQSIPLFLSPGSMWSVTFGWLRVYPVDILFWALSAATAFLLPRGEPDMMAPSGALVEPVG